MIRAFVALEIPPGLRQDLCEEQDRLRERLPRARWVRPASIHLTLKFLGDCQRDVLDALAHELRPALAGHGRVHVTLHGSGFFPSPRRPRVAWIGGQAEGAPEAVEVVDEVARRHGFSRERRRWALHLTLARLRDPWPSPAVESFLEWGEGLRLAPFDCSEVVLFESALRPEGAVYTALHRLPLD